ncbi:hypothetical protein AAKU67_002001 [Oxalobacteraceae bacterium GrIS 2.11]
MFNPSQQDVRRFFCESYRKTLAREILSPIEVIASDWIAQHPEYEVDLADVNAALEAEYPVDQGKTNPFLHLAMHLTITEQISINQPIGIKPAFTQLAQRLQSEHEAHHIMMECLGAMLWESQRNGSPFDGAAYVAAVMKAIQ